MINESSPSWMEWSLFWYFLSINFVYSILLILGAFVVYFRRKELTVEDFSYLFHSNSLPEITFLVPSFNEEKNILFSIDSILHLNYRSKQIIVINDGSTDDTMNLLKRTYDLVPIPKFYNESLASQPILGVYKSRLVPELVIIDKLHAGKYDAVNAGINACENPYFIAVDADGFLDNTGFEALIRPLLANPNTIAVGAAVRIKNGCTLNFNKVDTSKISISLLPVFQGLEYLRSFLQRQGWNYMGGNFVISGAFSIFPKQLIVQIGGFSSSVAEDMEIVVRLHRYAKLQKIPYEITYIPDPIAWTEGPSTLAHLGRQRTRWHLGLLETVYIHKNMCFNPRFGLYGFFNYPFWIWGEAIEPVAEALGTILIMAGFFMGFLNGPFALLLILVTLGFTFVYSVLCLFIEEVSFKKYSSLKTILMMFFLSIIENCGYRQLTVYWRLKAFYAFFKNFRSLSKETERINQRMSK